MASVLDFDEIGMVCATFAVKSGGSIAYDRTYEGNSPEFGRAATLSAAGGEVDLCADAEAVLGKLLKVEKDPTFTYVCTVQIAGLMTLPGGSGATLTRGKKIVGDLGAASAKGYIREVATGTAAELGVARGLIIDAADTAAVVVALY